MGLPQVRQEPWYPGQLGVRGSDIPLGLRWDSSGIVLYVNPDANNDSDGNDGLDTQDPLSTIQGAVTRLVAHQTAIGMSLRGSVIVCSGLAYDEAVTIPSTITDCRLVGSGPSYNLPHWASTAVNTTPCLTINAEGWVVEGFQFNPPALSAGIRVNWFPASSFVAHQTIIRNNMFAGGWSGLYGVEFVGAPANVHILDNWFLEMNNDVDTTAYCIFVSECGTANPYMCEIARNRFSDADNYIGNLNHAHGFNMSLFKDNVFEDGVSIVPTTFLDLRGGTLGYNIVTGNYFGGTYTQAGGYYANAFTPNNCWIGNMAEPTPAQVADNGFTIAVPV